MEYRKRTRRETGEPVFNRSERRTHGHDRSRWTAFPPVLLLSTRARVRSDDCHLLAQRRRCERLPVWSRSPSTADGPPAREEIRRPDFVHTLHRVAQRRHLVWPRPDGMGLTSNSPKPEFPVMILI